MSRIENRQVWTNIIGYFLSVDTGVISFWFSFCWICIALFHLTRTGDFHDWWVESWKESKSTTHPHNSRPSWGASFHLLAQRYFIKKWVSSCTLGCWSNYSIDCRGPFRLEMLVPRKDHVSQFVKLLSTRPNWLFQGKIDFVWSWFTW